MSQADEARELARELVNSQAWKDADWPADEEKLIAALLARTALEARKAALEEAARLFDLGWYDGPERYCYRESEVSAKIRSLVERASKGAGGERNGT